MVSEEQTCAQELRGAFCCRMQGIIVLWGRRGPFFLNCAKAPTLLQVWVLDSPLGETNGVNGQHSDTDKVISEILAIPLPVPSREWLYSYMTERGYSTAIQQWLGSNLIGTRGGFKWAFDISGASRSARSPELCNP